tara:strand:+ start:471 stop:890 length:420 start_codon:yes stop_codon:yes gene_type:complete
MRNIKTARGGVIDMSALANKYETTRAVGNVPMNARGDRLNTDGSVKVTAEEIAVAHHNNAEPPEQQALSDTKPITSSQPQPKAEPETQPEVNVPDLEEQFNEEPEAISRITRTRKDGTKFVEIEYDDGSIETLEISEEE